jgi:hypothetical protein
MVPRKNVFSILETGCLRIKNIWLYFFSSYIKITEEKITSIQNFVPTLFADKTLTNELSNDQKMSQFGPLYWNKQENLTFTLGENDSIQAAVEVSQKLIEGQTLPTLSLPQAAIFQPKRLR